MRAILIYGFLVLLLVFGGNQWLSACPEIFEVSASTYPWELHNESPAVVLDNLMATAKVNSAYLIALMHGSKRPKNIDRYPHDPRILIWQAEDACVYWHPDTTLYGRLKPVLSEHTFLNQTNWLKVFIAESRKRNLKTGVEISHYIIPKKILMKPENSDICQRDLHGNPVYIVCPNHPEGRKYILSLFDDLAKNYDLDFIQTCYLPIWDKSGSASGGSSCFCNSCMKKAQAEGINLRVATEILRQDPKNAEALQTYWQFHNNTLISLMNEIVNTIKKRNPAIEFRYNHHAKDMDWGRIMPDVVPLVNSVRISDYTEQYNSVDSLLKIKLPWIEDICKYAGKVIPVIAAVAVRPGATPELIRKSIALLAKTQVSGISLGHYESAPFSYLYAVQDGLTDTGIVKRDFRIETEDMESSGFQPFEYISEKGIKAIAAQATVQTVAPVQSGTYSIDLVAACENGCDALVTITAGDRELGKLHLSTSTDCWQRFTLIPASITKGDRFVISVYCSSVAKPIISSITFRESTR